MDGWRDGLNRLWRDGVVTILPGPAKKIATAKNNRPVPALEKKNTAPSRPVEKKKKRGNDTSKIHRPEGGNWKQIPPPVSLFLSFLLHIYIVL